VGCCGALEGKLDGALLEDHVGIAMMPHYLERLVLWLFARYFEPRGWVLMPPGLPALPSDGEEEVLPESYRELGEGVSVPEKLVELRALTESSEKGEVDRALERVWQACGQAAKKGYRWCYSEPFVVVGNKAPEMWVKVARKIETEWGLKVEMRLMIVHSVLFISWD